MAFAIRRLDTSTREDFAQPAGAHAPLRTAGERDVMGWLTADDELPAPPTRIVIAGTSGAGKSTLARRLAASLDVRHVELDALHHGPGWAPRPEFRADVERVAAAARWVTEWQYPAARDRLAARADLLVFLDLPRWLVMTRVVRRTLSRRLRRTRLWNENVEPPLRTVLTDRDHIIRWAWRTHDEHLPRVTECLRRHPELAAVRLRGSGEIERWLAGPVRRAVYRTSA